MLYAPCKKKGFDEGTQTDYALLELQEKLGAFQGLPVCTAPREYLDRRHSWGCVRFDSLLITVLPRTKKRKPNAILCRIR